MSTCGRSSSLCTCPQAVAGKRRDNAKALAPDRGEGLARGWNRSFRYRHRMDMTNPITIAPKPMAKFHADRVTIRGILSPAT